MIRATNKRYGTTRRIALAVLAFAMPLEAAPFKLLAIGDSLTEEYRFETLFSAPDNDPFVANTKNWVELLHAHRPLAFTMGGYEPSLGNYLDFRNAGYEYNYGVPGFKAERWVELLYKEYSFIDLLRPENIIALSTRTELRGDLGSVDAALIFIGGNDLSLANGDVKNDEIRFFIGRIHDYVRANARADLPIIVATVPDIGVTPKEKLSDPIAAQAARARVATLNANIIADLGARAHTHIARIDTLTDRIWDQVPFQINGTEFINSFDRQNPPLYLFCKEQFHPTTVGQALIANEILKAINTFAETPIPLFANREILTIIDQNPDQPYLDWAGAAGTMTENPDNDPLPNLIEFLLANDPLQPDPAFTFSPGGTASYTPSESALRFADLNVLQSATLGDDWIAVPAQYIETLPDGSVNLIPSGPRLFYKFAATPKP